ncbi:MAG TPA: hypothetical protein VMT31_03625 [Methanomicrobiales archaeon]|jgi:hypothetical protein|nr:hypothetical protein [Methanomicrobiales archaeon]
MHRIIARLKVELIVLFGYAVGLLLQAGLNHPQANVLAPLEARILEYIPDEYVRIILALFLLVILGFAVKKAFGIGSPAALIAVVMGFLAGLATPADLQISLAMLALGVISAWISMTGWKTLRKFRLKGEGG